MTEWGGRTKRRVGEVVCVYITDRGLCRVGGVSSEMLVFDFGYACD